MNDQQPGMPQGHGAPQGPYPPQQQWQQQPQQPKKNWFSRHKFLTALLVVVVLAAGGSALGGGSKSSSGANSGSSSSSKSSGGASSGASGGSSGSAAAPAPVGTPVRDGKFQFTVTRVERGQKSVGSDGADQTAQGEYTLVHVTVKNIGTEQQSLSDSDQKAMDANGTQYSPDSTADAYIQNNDVLFNQINPGNQVNGVMAFDTPVGKKLTKIEFHDSFLSNGVDAAL